MPGSGSYLLGPGFRRDDIVIFLCASAPLRLIKMTKTALIAAAVIFILDQITKSLVLKFVAGHKIALLPFFNLVLVWNRGVSFGMLSGDNPFAPLLLTIMSLIITGCLIVWATRLTDKGLAAAVCAVIAGALGNVVDRIRYGAVVDFLDFHIMGWHYPAFNVADSAIVLGIAFIVFDSIFLEAKRKNTEQT